MPLGPPNQEPRADKKLFGQERLKWRATSCRQPVGPVETAGHERHPHECVKIWNKVWERLQPIQGQLQTGS